MQHQTVAVSSRMHPLMVGAAASVTLVSLLGAAVITGILPSSHSTSAPAGQVAAAPSVTAAPILSTPTQSLTAVSTTRFITADGRIFEEVKSAPPARSTSVNRAAANRSIDRVQENRTSARHQASPHQRIAANSRIADDEPSIRRTRASEDVVQSTVPVTAQVQPVLQPPPQPVSVFGNVNPVQTGVGAVIGGLLGSQIGKGNGRTLATVAGVIAGGYAGNEISHGRNPIPTW